MKKSIDHDLKTNPPTVMIRQWFCWRKSESASKKRRLMNRPSVRRVIVQCLLWAEKAALAAGFLLCGLALPAAAQDPEVRWYSSNGGGGGVGAHGGVYWLQGSVQPHGTTSRTGDPYGHTGGFWVIGALLMPGAPGLEIMVVNGAVHVMWETDFTEFVLEECTELNAPDGESGLDGDSTAIQERRKPVDVCRSAGTELPGLPASRPVRGTIIQKRPSRN